MKNRIFTTEKRTPLFLKIKQKMDIPKYRVGDTIKMQLKWSTSMDTMDFKLRFYDEKGSRRHEVLKSSMEKVGNAYVVTIPHEVTKHWPHGSYTIDSAVWTDKYGWVKSCKKPSKMFVGPSEIGGTL